MCEMESGFGHWTAVARQEQGDIAKDHSKYDFQIGQSIHATMFRRSE